MDDARTDAGCMLAAVTLSPETLSPGTFLAIVAVSAIAGTLATLAAERGVLVPVVVLELLLGIVLGPHVLGLHVSEFVEFFSNLGLGFLFFFAGYEIDLRRISGRPLRLALLGWAMSLALAFGLAGALVATGIVVSALYTGSAFATTAIGTLIPVLSDAGELRSRFGTYLLAAGGVGEFGPIVLLTLILSSQSELHTSLILLAFASVALGVAFFVRVSSARSIVLFERTLEKSSQLAVRWIIVLVFALALLAYDLGLDLLIGGFAAGIIARSLLRAHDVPAIDSKLTAIGFGVFVPFFFVVSGMELDVGAIVGHASGVAKLAIFLVLLLVVRGTPALLLYRHVLVRRDRIALGLLSATQLPLVVAITAVATKTGRMDTSTAAALVGAAVLSTLIFPILGLRLRPSVAPPMRR
jgi:Kef-type K+ transport system membrane component KefB